MKKYNAEDKTKVILDIIQRRQGGEYHLCRVMYPSMVRAWKQEFLQNVQRAFDSDSEQKTGQRKDVTMKRKSDQIFKTVRRLTLERDFLQRAFAESLGSSKSPRV